jgi:hypothetical protein
MTDFTIPDIHARVITFHARNGRYPTPADGFDWPAIDGWLGKSGVTLDDFIAGAAAAAGFARVVEGGDPYDLMRIPGLGMVIKGAKGPEAEAIRRDRRDATSAVHPGKSPAIEGGTWLSHADAGHLTHFTDPDVHVSYEFRGPFMTPSPNRLPARADDPGQDQAPAEPSAVDWSTVQVYSPDPSPRPSPSRDANYAPRPDLLPPRNYPLMSYARSATGFILTVACLRDPGVNVDDVIIWGTLEFRPAMPSYPATEHRTAPIPGTPFRPGKSWQIDCRIP